MVALWASKSKALSSIPNTTKKRKKERKKEAALYC
jgi:hypothetical protein